jgi:hypothetical protein
LLFFVELKELGRAYSSQSKSFSKNLSGADEFVLPPFAIEPLPELEVHG